MIKDQRLHPGLDLRLIEQQVDRLDAGDLVWLSAGASGDLAASVHGAHDPVDLGTRLARGDRDAAFGLLDRRYDRVPTLHLWRGLLSPFDWFIGSRSDGRTIVSDDFRSVIALLPVGDREVDGDALIQHYLSTTVSGTVTYMRRIRRLGVGEYVSVDLRSGEISAELIDRIASEADLVGPDRYLSVVEDALEEVMEPLGGREDVVASFSGGVDSTLLATFLQPGDRLLNVTPDTPEFGVETAYARDAAALLGMPYEEVPVREEDYVELLERVILDIARPPPYDTVPFFAKQYERQPDGLFISGLGADGLFGSGARAARVAELAERTHLSSLALRATRLASDDTQRRAEMVLGKGKYIVSDPWSPGGYTGAGRIYGDPRWIRGVVGQDEIDRLILAALEYTRARVDFVEPDDRFLSHMEISQWRATFGDHLRIGRETARSQRATVVAPFRQSTVVDALVRIPVKHRYVRRFTGKWILKDMLAARLPGYAVGKRKRHTELPLARYCVDGPLTDIWERYDPPSIFDSEARSLLVDNALPEATLWNAITYAVWDELVLKNPSLTPHDAVISIGLDVETVD